MAKKQMYAIGILFKDNTIKYVTGIGERNWAKWESGKEAMEFSKEMALDMCKGFAWNGISAIPILKLDWVDLKNPSDPECYGGYGTEKSCDQCALASKCEKYTLELDE